MYGYDPLDTVEGWRLFDNAVAWATATTFAHDANGNLTRSSDGLSLGYNTADQTTTIETAGQAEVTADYAGAGQIDRIALGSDTFASTLLGVSRHDRSGAVQAVTRDPHGGLVGLRDPDRGRHYYLFDALGSVIAVTDATGQVVNRYDYDPYGTTTESCPTPAGCVDNPWRFTGEQQDPTGLYKIGHRYYQPEQGRWTQPDPLQGRINPAMPGETNPYAYAGSNPINFTDSTGLNVLIDFIDFAQLVTAGVVLVGLAVGGVAVFTLGCVVGALLGCAVTLPAALAGLSAAAIGIPKIIEAIREAYS